MGNDEWLVVCMPMRNGRDTVVRAVESVAAQQGTRRRLMLVVADDGSTDGSAEWVAAYEGGCEVVLLRVSYGEVYRVRNFLEEWVREHVPGCVLMGRLDVDDVLYDAQVLQKIEQMYDTEGFDVWIGSNAQQRDGAMLEWVNRPEGLLDKDLLEQRLERMAAGDARAELPSTNVFVRPKVRVEYPAVDSGEDHWRTVKLLMQAEQWKIRLAPELVYMTYTLGGMVSHAQMTGEAYVESRRSLLTYYREWKKQ